MKFTKIYSIIVTTITIAVMLISMVIVIPRLFGIECYVVKSGSMEPTLNVGSLTYIDTNKTSLNVGDIAVYKITQDNNETLVIHRVISKTDDGYQFQGDANQVADANLVKQNQIVGSYIFQIQKVGFILARFNPDMITKLIILLVILNVSVILIEKYSNKEADNFEN
ncbi:MAG: signal peptidase I [Oscillospiraceae bacterium]